MENSPVKIVTITNNMTKVEETMEEKVGQIRRDCSRSGRRSLVLLF